MIEKGYKKIKRIIIFFFLIRYKKNNNTTLLEEYVNIFDVRNSQSICTLFD